MLIVGLGQYPNLGVTDAFALLRRGSAHRVVRTSRELGADRMNTRVGPFGVEDAARMWGMINAVGRFDYDGHTGYGLYEYWALGDHPSFR